MWRLPFHGVRARVIAWFALIAFVLSISLGVITFLTVRRVLIAEMETNALDQALVDSRLVTSTIRSGLVNEAQVLVSLRPPVRSRPFLLRDGEWYAASLQIAPDDLPPSLVGSVLDGDPARQRSLIAGSPALTIGIPLDPGRAAYFEVFDLTGLAGTLGALRRTLFFAGSFTTLAGAVLGLWAAQRALRPLRMVTQVAEQIAAGNLESRLDETLDPDLARISGSFNQMAESLARRIDRETRFASDVAHELRSPLTTLATALSVVERRRDELSPTGQEALDLLTLEVERFQRMVQDMIEMSRHDAGMVTVELEEVQATEAIREILGRLGRTDLLDIDPAVLGTVIRVDPRRLERVFANLIDNADRHGGGATRVSLEPAPGLVRVVVVDHGRGIPPEERDDVFGRFNRGSGSGRRGDGEGAGLGLALAFENARLQDSAIVVEDNPGGGARMVVEIPVARG